NRDRCFGRARLKSNKAKARSMTCSEGHRIPSRLRSGKVGHERWGKRAPPPPMVWRRGETKTACPVRQAGRAGFVVKGNSEREDSATGRKSRRLNRRLTSRGSGGMAKMDSLEASRIR